MHYVWLPGNVVRTCCSKLCMADQVREDVGIEQVTSRHAQSVTSSSGGRTSSTSGKGSSEQGMQPALSDRLHDQAVVLLAQDCLHPLRVQTRAEYTAPGCARCGTGGHGVQAGPCRKSPFRSICQSFCLEAVSVNCRRNAVHAAGILRDTVVHGYAPLCDRGNGSPI